MNPRTPGGVAIAGAGLIGTSIAWRLSQAGIPVSLFDAGMLGGEASSAGAGMLAPGGEFEKPSRWLDLGLESFRLYPDFVGELREESGLPIDFQICGCVHLTRTDEERRAARDRAAFQARAGIRVETTPDGLFYPEDSLVDPTDLLRALRRACEARQVRILERQPLREIEASEHAAVVIAAGAWSGQIHVRYRNQPVPIPGTIPVKGHLIGFELPPGMLGPMRRHGHTYVLQRSNGFAIAGSTEQHAGFDRAVDPEICEDIHRCAAAVFPRLGDLKPCRRWIGFRPQSLEASAPHIGRVEGTNVWLAYGHYRNGILLTPLTARKVADEIVKSLNAG